MAGHGCLSTGLSRGGSAFASRSPRACVYISYDLMMDFDETRNFLRHVPPDLVPLTEEAVRHDHDAEGRGCLAETRRPRAGPWRCRGPACWTSTQVTAHSWWRRRAFFMPGGAWAKSGSRKAARSRPYSSQVRPRMMSTVYSSTPSERRGLAVVVVGRGLRFSALVFVVVGGEVNHSDRRRDGGRGGLWRRWRGRGGLRSVHLGRDHGRKSRGWCLHRAGGHGGFLDGRRGQEADAPGGRGGGRGAVCDGDTTPTERA